MSFYYAKAATFLQDVKHFVLRKYQDNLHETVVLVPNVYVANQVLQDFVKDCKGPSLLPKIVPIEEIKIVNNAIVTLDKMELASYFEQQILIADILYRSRHYNFSPRQSIDLSKSMLVLLHEFIKSNCEPKNISSLSCDHFSQLQTLAKFLQDVKDELFINLSKAGVQDVVQFCISNCNTLSQIINNGLYKGNLVIVGIEEPFIFNLLKKALEAQLDVILPSLSEGDLCKRVSKLMDYCGVNPKDIVELRGMQNRTSTIRDFGKVIEYRTFPNAIKELDFLIDLILSSIKENSKQKIAVVLDDLEMNHTLIQTLRGYGIEVKNSLGLSLSRNIFVQFLMLIRNLWQQHASVKDLVALLKHPYLDGDLSQQFEHFAVTSCIIFQSLSEAIVFIQKQSQEVFEIVQKLQSILQGEQLFCYFLEGHLTIAQELYKYLWQRSEYGDISDYVKDLVGAAKYFGKVNIYDYCHIFEKLLQGKFYENSILEAQVEVLSPKNIAYASADFCIIPNFHDESWPNLGDSDIWLSNNIRFELGLSDVRAVQLEKYRNYFFCALSFPRVFLTRADKIGNKETIDSRFWSQRAEFQHLNYTGI